MSRSRRYRDNFSLLSQNNSLSRAKRTHFIRYRAMTLTSVAVYDSVKQWVSFLSSPKTGVTFISRISVKCSVSFALWTSDVFLINDPFLNPEHRLLHIYINRNPHINPFSVQNLLLILRPFLIHEICKITFKIIKVLKPWFPSLRGLLFLFLLHLRFLVMPSLIPRHLHIV